jgi:hypothetical protein
MYSRLKQVIYLTIHAVVRCRNVFYVEQDHRRKVAERVPARSLEDNNTAECGERSLELLGVLLRHVLLENLR